MIRYLKGAADLEPASVSFELAANNRPGFSSLNYAPSFSVARVN